MQDASSTHAFHRGAAAISVDTDVSAGTIFEAYADWVHVDRYFPSNFPFRYLRIEYAPGSGPDHYPCTRHMYLDRASLPSAMQNEVPDYFSETVYSADPETATINYSVDGIGPFGSRNYFACTTIDVLGEHRARVNTASRFDLPVTASVADYRAMLEQLYHWQVAGIVEWAKANQRR